MNPRKAISSIEKRGMLLVFPIGNKPNPPSLWTEFFPRSEMRWEWDSDGDHRVADLWHLREELSRSRKVVYAKWYKNRATFFSLKAFELALSFLNATPPNLGRNSTTVLELSEEDSPRSSKELKRMASKRGVDPKQFEKALKPLWERLLIVGFGEVDDGAFPSLSIGATSVLFEDCFRRARERHAHLNDLRDLLNTESLFLNQFEKLVPAVTDRPRKRRKTTYTYEELTKT